MNPSLASTLAFIDYFFIYTLSLLLLLNLYTDLSHRLSSLYVGMENSDKYSKYK